MFQCLPFASVIKRWKACSRNLIIVCCPVHCMAMYWSIDKAFNGYCNINNMGDVKITLYWTRLACYIGQVLCVISAFSLLPINSLRYQSPLIYFNNSEIIRNKEEVPQNLKCVQNKSSPHKRQGQPLQLKYFFMHQARSLLRVLCSGLIK